MIRVSEDLDVWMQGFQGVLGVLGSVSVMSRAQMGPSLFLTTEFTIGSQYCHGRVGAGISRVKA